MYGGRLTPHWSVLAYILPSATTPLSMYASPSSLFPRPLTHAARRRRPRSWPGRSSPLPSFPCTHPTFVSRSISQAPRVLRAYGPPAIVEPAGTTYIRAAAAAAAGLLSDNDARAVLLPPSHARIPRTYRTLARRHRARRARLCVPRPLQQCAVPTLHIARAVAVRNVRTTPHAGPVEATLVRPEPCLHLASRARAH